MTIYIVDIEAVDTRYTKQWKEHVPAQMREHASEDVVVISGGDVPQSTTPGAFLNFGGTNVYKSNQLMQIGELFCNGQVKDGDYFLYTDAWNPTVIQLKYMAELLGVKIRIGGMWHAGSYDPHDFLGRLIGDEPWVRHAEKSMFECYDDNFFATDFHIELFADVMSGHDQLNPAMKDTFNKTILRDKCIRVGWPMEYLADELAPYANLEKENIVLFPHRIAPEKQVDIFKDLAKEFPDYEFIVCQEQNLTKHEYHTLLGKSKMVFSANLQETLGISCYEGALVNSYPFVPSRLSYREMYESFFRYNSKWTESFESYLEHKEHMISWMREVLDRNYWQASKLGFLQEKLRTEFFSGTKIYEAINERR